MTPAALGDFGDHEFHRRVEHLPDDLRPVDEGIAHVLSDVLPVLSRLGDLPNELLRGDVAEARAHDRARRSLELLSVLARHERGVRDEARARRRSVPRDVERRPRERGGDLRARVERRLGGLPQTMPDVVRDMVERVTEVVEKSCCLKGRGDH